MEKKSYTVAIDLGSSNVVVAVGSKREDGTLGIEAVVSKPVGYADGYARGLSNKGAVLIHGRQIGRAHV